MRPLYPNLALTVLVLASCTADKSEVTTQDARLAFEPETITLLQRSSQRVKPLGVTIRIGDITAGQVLVRVDDLGGDTLVPLRSMRVGDSTTFDLGGEGRTIGLVRMKNHLFGDDFAEFQIGTGEEVKNAQIEALLEKIATSKLTFVRNGTEHSGQSAADHLRTKLRFAGSRVTTAQEFIEHIAAKSSSTGEPYVVKVGSATQPLAAWLRGTLVLD